jgi:hypothetical protein
MFLKIEEFLFFSFNFFFNWFNYDVAKSSGKQHHHVAFAIIVDKFVQNCPTRLDV